MISQSLPISFWTAVSLSWRIRTNFIYVITHNCYSSYYEFFADLKRQDSYNTVAAAIMTLLSPLWTAVLAFLSLMANPKNGYKVILITNKHPYL